MSLDGEIEQDNTCHVSTPETFLERLNATQAEGISFMEVIHDIPPDACATSHPEAFKEGFPLPDTENSNVTLAAQTGLYTFAGLAQSARDIYIEHNPDVELSFALTESVDAKPKGLTAEFSSIASLFTETEAAPKPEDKPDPQERVDSPDIPMGPR